MIFKQAMRVPKLGFKFTDGAEPVVGSGVGGGSGGGKALSGDPFGFSGGLGWAGLVGM